MSKKLKKNEKRKKKVIKLIEKLKNKINLNVLISNNISLF